MGKEKSARTGTRRKTGPPRRTDWQEPFLAEIEKNVVVGLACKEVGIAPSTFTRERQRNEEFSIAYSDARERGLDTLEATLRMRATRGQPIRKRVTKKDADGNVLEITDTEEVLVSTTAAIFLLKRYRPEFRESFRVESTGAGGGPIKHEIEVTGALDELDSELDRLAGSG